MGLASLLLARDRQGALRLLLLVDPELPHYSQCSIYFVNYEHLCLWSPGVALVCAVDDSGGTQGNAKTYKWELLKCPIMGIYVDP